MTFDSASLEPEYPHVKKVCGTDFDAAIFDSNKHLDKLVLITHPDGSKNFNIEAEFDSLAKRLQSKRSLKNCEFYLYNGLNENAKFKAPRKLPTLLFFRSGMGLDEQPVQLDRFKLLDCIGHNNRVDQAKLGQTLRSFVVENNQQI